MLSLCAACALCCLEKRNKADDLRLLLLANQHPTPAEHQEVDPNPNA